MSSPREKSARSARVPNENPIARLYASLAPRNGVNGVKFRTGGVLVLPTILFPRRTSRRAMTNPMEMRMNDRSSRKTRFTLVFPASGNLSNEAPSMTFHNSLSFFLLFLPFFFLSLVDRGIMRICLKGRWIFAFVLGMTKWNVFIFR